MNRIAIRRAPAYMIAGLSALMVAGCSMIEGTGPVPYTRKAYTATYERKQAGKIESWIVSSNGKGRTVTKINSQQRPFYCITDFLEGKCYYLREQKTGEWVGAKNTGSFLADEDWLKSMPEVVWIGEKEIDGHQCRGWKYVISTGEAELWFGSDTGCLVYGVDRDYPSTGRHDAGWTQRLVKYSDQPLPEDAFSTSGYHFVNW